MTVLVFSTDRALGSRLHVLPSWCLSAPPLPPPERTSAIEAAPLPVPTPPSGPRGPKGLRGAACADVVSKERTVGCQQSLYDRSSSELDVCLRY